MSEFELGTWSDRLPEWSRGELSDEERAELERALSADADLREEADVVRRIREARPEPPQDLVARINESLGEARPGRGKGWMPGGWWLSTAAVFVLALGTSVLWRGRGPATTLNGSDVPIDPVIESWLLDDGVIAGGAVLEDLSDEQLTTLLDDLGV